MAHPTCIPVTCETCDGSGRVLVTRSRWIGGTGGYRSTVTSEVRCDDCLGYGERYVSQFSPEAAAQEKARMRVEVESGDNGYMVVGGYRIYAPTFTDADQYDRAIGRAFADGIRVEPTDRPDMWLTTNPRTGASYTTSRTACSCRAGQGGVGCKHVAMVAFLADVAGELEGVPA